MRKALDIPLHVELGLLFIGRFPKRHDTVVFLVHIPHDPSNCAALSGGVSAVEQDDDLLARFLEVLHHLDELRLVGDELGLGKMALESALDDVFAFLFLELPTGRPSRFNRLVGWQAVEDARNGFAYSAGVALQFRAR